MRYPLCKGRCGNRLVSNEAAADVLKGGRRRNYEAGYCQACWTARKEARNQHIVVTLTPEQRTVLAMLDTKIADEAERRDFAEALGLVGEPA